MRLIKLAVALFAVAGMLVPCNLLAVTITVNGSVKKGSVPHFWETCVGRAGFRYCWRPAFDTGAKIGAQEAGFKMVRGHGMLMGVDGLDSIGMFHWDGNVADTPTYTWNKFDSVINILHACGVEPVMELDFMPKDLQSNGVTSKPKNWAIWQRFMTALANHCIQKYGKATAESWYWEVWNEPDYGGFWNGTMNDYDTMYAYAAAGIKAADSLLKVGGPATTGFNSSLQGFVTYCTNNHVPLDFISNHQYGGGGSGPSADPVNIRNDNRSRASLIKSNGKNWGGLNTEYSSSYSGQGGNNGANCISMDSHVNAPFIAKCVKLILDDDTSGAYALPNALSYWVISDCFDEGSYIENHNFVPFGEVFGLINYQGIRKAAFNAYKLLHMMDTTRISLSGGSSDADGVDGFATVSGDSTQIKILIYNFYTALAGTANANPVTLTVNNLPFATGQTVQVTHYRIDSLHSNPYAVWEKQGKPAIPTTAQWDSMKAAQNLALLVPTSTFSYTRGTSWTDTFTMPRQSVSLLVLSTGTTKTLKQTSARNRLALSITGATVKAEGLQGSALTLRIYSLNGKLLKRYSTLRDCFDLRKIAPEGTYIVTAQAMGERVTSKVIIRNY